MVATLAEFKAALRRADSADDTMLTEFLDAASTITASLISAPAGFDVTAVAEVARLHRLQDIISPRKRPLVTVTDLTPDFATAVSSTTYTIDSATNTIRLLYRLPPGTYALNYTAGLTSIPSNVKRAGLIIAQHLWQTENGGGGLPYPGDQMITVSGFAVPRRAAQMLGVGDTASFGAFA